MWPKAACGVQRQELVFVLARRRGMQGGRGCCTELYAPRACPALICTSNTPPHTPPSVSSWIRMPKTSRLGYSVHQLADVEVSVVNCACGL